MAEDMLAAVLEDFNRLTLKRVPRPVAGNGEAVVRIKSCGFCATDFKAIRGIRRNVEFPLIPGHEPSGVVESVGPGVDSFRPGDAVIVTRVVHEYESAGIAGICMEDSRHPSTPPPGMEPGPVDHKGHAMAATPQPAGDGRHGVAGGPVDRVGQGGDVPGRERGRQCGRGRNDQLCVHHHQHGQPDTDRRDAGGGAGAWSSSASSRG